MRKSGKLLAALAATMAMSVLFAGSAMAMYELYDVQWDDDDDYSTEATWDDDDCDYGSYQVKLIRNGNDDDPERELTTSAQHHDFRDNITREGTYTFRVRVRFGDYDEGDWFESDELDVDEEFLHHIHGTHYDDDNDGGGYVAGPGSVSPGPSGSTTYGSASGPAAAGVSSGWHQNSNGQWYYINADGTYPKGGWDYINNYWYYFNINGIMQTGWIKSNDGNDYYCAPYQIGSTPQGAMLTNAWTPDGYYVNAQGIWQQNITP